MGKVKDFLVASGMVSGGVGGHVLARRMGVRPCDRGGNGHAATAAAPLLNTISPAQNADVRRVCVCFRRPRTRSLLAGSPVPSRARWCFCSSGGHWIERHCNGTTHEASGRVYQRKTTSRRRHDGVWSSVVLVTVSCGGERREREGTSGCSVRGARPPKHVSYCMKQGHPYCGRS